MINRVLVTGASGFIGGHIVADLLRRGFAVRGSVRNRSRTDEVHAAMAAAHVDTTELEICELDLLSDSGWVEAVDGCRYVLHVASPFVLDEPRHPDDLIRPAVEGATRAVATALDAGVQRIVMTSALATMQFAHTPKGHLYTDLDWTDPDDRRLNAYTVSKVRAELAALDLAGRREATDRLALINPGAVIGPLLTRDPGTSVTAIQQLMSGALPLAPDLRLPWVDVRDVSDAHIAAMTDANAGGRRTIVATDPMSLVDVARTLRTRLPSLSGKVPARSMPTWATWLASVFEPQLKANRWLIGANQRFDRAAAETLIGHELRPIRDAIVQTAESLAEHELV